MKARPTAPLAWPNELEAPLRAAALLTPWDTLVLAAQRHPEGAAIVSPDGDLTYAELLEAALRCAARLALLGVEKGTVVATIFESSRDWIVLHYALGRLGAIALPINYGLSARELEALLREAEPILIVTGGSVAGALADDLLRAIDLEFSRAEPRSTMLPSVRRIVHVGDAPSRIAIYGTDEDALIALDGAAGPDDPALILFTSGSTARPKGAVIAGRGFAANGAALALALRMTAEDRFILLFPNFHAMGAVLATTTASAGAALHLIDVFTPQRALIEIERGRCTTTFGLDTHWVKLLSDPDVSRRQLTSLTRVGSGGSRGLWQQLHDTFDFELIVTAYGSTELSSWGTLSEPAAMPDSQGRVLPGLDFRIIDPVSGAVLPAATAGEICFRGWARFLGYLSAESRSILDPVDPEGFFHSGDYGLIDDQGRLRYLGRYKMMVKTGGENVSEVEVETFISDTMSDVDVVQVVGAPDPVWGEAIVAFVQFAPGMASVDSEVLRERCRSGIARFKIPKLFIPMSDAEWPRLANTKIDKKALRAVAADAYAAHLSASA